MYNSPVVIFGYNRPDRISELLRSLEKCEGSKETKIYIFIDGPKTEKDKKKVMETYNISKMDWSFKSKEVILSHKNKGLANSVIYGVSEIINKFGRVIVLEDDLVVNPNFLKVMNSMLDCYEKDEDIWAICGYSFPINLNSLEADWYAVKRASSWGWASWRNRWNSVEWDLDILLDKNKEKLKSLFQDIPDSKMMIFNFQNNYINSWALRGTLNQYFLNKISLSPKNSIIKNNGFNLEGTHGSVRNNYNHNYLVNYEPSGLIYENNLEIQKLFREFCKPTKVNRFSFLLKKLGLYNFIRKKIKK
jgi:Glycosyl transferase family 2